MQSSFLKQGRCRWSTCTAAGVDSPVASCRRFGAVVAISSGSSYISSCSEASSFLERHQGALGIDASTLILSEVENGRMNFVFKAFPASSKSSSGETRLFLIKSSPPYVKSLGKGKFPLTQKRLHNEARALEMVSKAAERGTTAIISLVPELILFVEEENTMVAGFIDSAVDMRSAFFRSTSSEIDCHAFSDAMTLLELAPQLGTGLATNHFKHSVHALGPDEVAQDLYWSFPQPDVFEGSVHMLLLDAFDPRFNTNRYPPELEELLSDLRMDESICRAHQHLINRYTESREGLIHNDLHIGNIIFSSSSRRPYVIDWELALVGPIAADVGSLIGNFILAGVCSNCSSSHPSVGKQTWMDALRSFWHFYSSTFRSLLVRRPQKEKDQVIRELWVNSVGFAATTIVRLTIGMHHFPPLDQMSQDDQLTTSTKLIEIGRLLLGQYDKAVKNDHTIDFDSFLANLQ